MKVCFSRSSISNCKFHYFTFFLIRILSSNNCLFNFCSLNNITDEKTIPVVSKIMINKLIIKAPIRCNNLQPTDRRYVQS